MDSEEKKRVLLTGASGFIGGEILEQLKEQGYEVIAACRGLSSETLRNSVAGHIKVDFTSDEARSQEFWKEKLEEFNIDYVINTAAVVRGKAEVFEAVNYEAPKALFEAANEISADREKGYKAYTAFHSRSPQPLLRQS